jgi:hypothetical protein
MEGSGDCSGDPQGINTVEDDVGCVDFNLVSSHYKETCCAEPRISTELWLSDKSI